MSADLTVPPLPVVALYSPSVSSPPYGEPLVRKADADAALASLQARLEAAERDAALWRQWAPYLSRVQHGWPTTPPHRRGRDRC